MALKFFLFIFTALSFSSLAEAQEGLSYLVRQPTTMAMGGAGVGLADDEYALFQNAAGLAGRDKKRWKLLGLGVEGSTDTYNTFGKSLNAVKNFNTNSLNALMGKDIHFRADAMTMVELPQFAIAYIVDAQGSINQFNQANPTFKVGDMITHGVQAGLGYNIKRGGRNPTDEFRVGGAAKVLWRRGGYYNVSTSGFLQATNSGKGYIDTLVGGYGMGIGVDLGLQYVNHLDKKTDLSFGASVTDIADTKFSDTHAQALPMNVGFGLGFKKNIDFFKFKLGADLRNLSQNVTFCNKTHLGAEVSIPLLDFYVGLNQLNFTYGVGFDIWLARVMLVSYTDELGVSYHQNPSTRYMLQVDVMLPI